MSRFVCLLTLLLSAHLLIAVPVQSLIQNLGDPDPSIRDNAEKQLTANWFAARPLLVQAARSPSPQISSRAAEVLMKLPWFSVLDPKPVREALLKYGEGSNDDRMQIITNIAQLPGGEPALLRLVHEDPSEAVSWHATLALRLIESERIAQTLRRMDLTDARVQMVALAGRAWLPADHKKGIELLREAIEDDSDDDGTDNAPLDFAYRVLIADALDHHDLNAALKLQRLRVERSATNGDASLAVFNLLALYADHGLTEEFGDDIANSAAYLGKPEVMYALGRLENLTDDGSNLMLEAIDRSALAASLMSPESHLRVSQIVSERAWDPETRLELYSILSLQNSHPDITRVAARYYAHMGLAHVAEANDDHASIVAHLQAIMKDSETLANAMQLDLSLQKNQIACHQLHIARATGEKKQADKLLHDLLEVPDPDVDVAIEVVNDLKADDRLAEAGAYFDKCYKLQTAQLAMRLKAAETLNNIAWLCARTHEHTDEAVSLAKRAMALKPEDYAYIDTAASACFAAGDSAKAVELEKRALNMRPRDVFMRKQLEIFGKKENAETQRRKDTEKTIEK